MTLLLEEHRTRMLANGRANAILSGGDLNTCDFPPVVKLLNPCGGAAWLLSELDNDDPDIAFGLCDLGMGFPELGSVSISELERYKGPLGIGIERDEHFEASMALSAYAERARVAGRIVA